MRGENFAHSHEGPNDQNVHLNGALAIEHGGEYRDAVFGEGERKITVGSMADV